MAQEIALQTGCLVEEAEHALNVEPNAVRATKLILRELGVRRKRYTSTLSQIWAKYAPGDQVTTDYDGTIEMVSDLHVELNDEVLLALAYELQAPKIGVFAKAPYIDGWARYSCESLEDMIHVTQRLKNKMQQDNKYFGRVYRYAFSYIVTEGQRMLALDHAVAYWQLLLVPRFDMASKWIEYVTKLNYSVSRDTWNMALVFLEYAVSDPTLADYDENFAWPAIIDDFVDSIKGA